MPTVRQAKPSDAEGIAAVQVEAWRAAYRGLLPDDVLDDLMVEEAEQRWRERIVNPWGQFFVIEREDEIVGYVACGENRDEDVDDERVGEIYAIYVHPEEWRRGNGAVLVGKAIEQLRADGYEEVILWVLSGNEQAIGFYERVGFEADGGSKVKQRADGTQMDVVRYRQSIE
jgi:ribosomal protein S18 acetylase RimI-like enzyme